MCIFNRAVAEVKGTKILVGRTEDGRQLTVYENQVAMDSAASSNASDPLRLSFFFQICGIISFFFLIAVYYFFHHPSYRVYLFLFFPACLLLNLSVSISFSVPAPPHKKIKNNTEGRAPSTERGRFISWISLLSQGSSLRARLPFLGRGLLSPTHCNHH